MCVLLWWLHLASVCHIERYFLVIWWHHRREFLRSASIFFQETLKQHSRHDTQCFWMHYNDVIMSAMASQIIGILIVYSTVCSGADKRKHPSSASPAFVGGINRWPVNSPHKGPVTRKVFPCDDVIMHCVIMATKLGWRPVAYFTEGVYPSLAKLPLNTSIAVQQNLG